MRGLQHRVFRSDRARASSRMILPIIVITVIIFVGSYAADGGFARFSGNSTVKASLAVVETGSLTPNEKISVAISNVTGNLSLSDVKMSVTDSYGTTVSQTFKNGIASAQAEEGASNGVIPKYLYTMEASGGGGFLTNTTVITITVSGGTPTHLSRVALIDSLSAGTIGSWSS